MLHNQTLISADHNGQAYARFDYDFNNDLSFYTDARYGVGLDLRREPGLHQHRRGNIRSGSIAATRSSPRPSRRRCSPPAPPPSISRASTTIWAPAQTSSRRPTPRRSRPDLRARPSATSHGTSTTPMASNAVTLLTINNMNTRRFYAAIDAVVDPATGQTVCRASITAPGAFPGCVPLNILGQNNSSTAAQQYIFGNTSWQAKNKMDDFAVNLTGTVFEGWAGPIKTAVGMEYRHQSLKVVTSEPNGVTFNPQNLRLAPFGRAIRYRRGYRSQLSSNLAWFKEVQSGAAGRGRYHRGQYRTGRAAAQGLAVRPVGLAQRRLSLHGLFDQRYRPRRNRVIHLLGQHLQGRPGMVGERRCALPRLDIARHARAHAVGPLSAAGDHQLRASPTRLYCDPARARGANAWAPT